MNETLFHIAFEEAQAAFQEDEVPVGAVIFDSRTAAPIAAAHNATEGARLPLAHAEVLAIQAACGKLGVKNLSGCSIYVTLEPCAMCAAAISLARLDALYFGAYDPKTGGVEQGARLFAHPQTHHKPQVQGGLYAEPCGALLSRFFKQKRGK